MTRMELINSLIEKFQYECYLEIGISEGHTFNKIVCKNKIGVDPNGGGTHQTTSDQFFSSNSDKFDVIFIDGLHLSDQVDRDLINSLICINRGGRIIVHDCLPYQEEYQRREPIEASPWWGDVWKSFAKFRKEWNLPAYVIDTDCGFGVIECDKQPAKIADFCEELNWEKFISFRNELLGVVSIDDFKRKLGQ
jgi:hypothetical protein